MTKAHLTKRHLTRRLLGSLLAVLLLLALLEFVVVTLDVAPSRPVPILVWNPQQDAAFRDEASAFREDPRWLWEWRPSGNLDGVPINEDGYRGRVVPRQKGETLRIATLGDSSTFGLGVEDDETWPFALERQLREEGVDVEVVNFGVVGYTAVQGSALFLGRVRAYRPDVVIAAFGAVNEQRPGASGLSDVEKIILMSRPDMRLRGFMERYSLFRLLRKAVDSAAPAPSSPHEGVMWRSRVSLEEFGVAIQTLGKTVERDGGALVLVSPPRRPDGEAREIRTKKYTTALGKLAPKLGVPLVDVRGEFREIDDREIGPIGELADGATVDSRLFVDAWHPSAEGHRLYADCLVRALRSQSLLER